MDTQAILKRIAQKAQQDAKRRQDPRYRETLGFLMAKGLLYTNQPVGKQRRLAIKDALWAGRNLEPRILEVLPAAILRFPRAVDAIPENEHALQAIVDGLKTGAMAGPALDMIPYAKIKVWLNHPLPDGRLKTPDAKRIARTHRFRPETLKTLKALAEAEGCTETEALERCVKDRVSRKIDR